MFSELTEFVDQRKRVYLCVLSILLIIFILIVIKYCDIPVWSFLPVNLQKIFLKKPNADMTLYDIGISYITSYVFYLLVSFIPEFLSHRERTFKDQILKRVIQREIGNFTSKALDLWISMYRVAIKNGVDYLKECVRIEEIFTFENVAKVAHEIILSHDSNKNANSGGGLDWFSKIEMDLEYLHKNGNEILTRYKSNLSANVFGSVFYLINDSVMFDRKKISENFHIHGGKEFRHSENIGISTDYAIENVVNSCKCLIDLFYWTNQEFHCISKEKNINIITMCTLSLPYFHIDKSN